MGKKKFIDKNNSQKFHLLHRSLLDEAHAKEGVPSEYVLVPAGHIAETRDRPSAPISEVLKSKRDHVNEFGFVNDGYDYNQHLREMGGGRFMGKDGHFHDLPRPVSISLPEEVLASEGALRRDFEAITISEEVMDEDLRAALFDDADEEGDFELLDDDFVEQVMKEPEVPDFDFDAHIAALIARSEQQLVSTNKARGWDDADAKKLKKIRNKKSIGFDELDSDGELIEDDEDDDESGYFDSDFEHEEEDDEAPDSVKAERQAALDAQLEDALAEYDDAHIGDLQELLEEEELEETGGVDFEDDMLNQALDEFLQDQKDSVLAYGTHVRKGARNVLLLKKNEQNEYVHEELHPVAEGPVDFKKECEEQNKLQEEWKEKMQELEEESKEIEKDLETCQEYLREVKVTEEWDCETIISTYSTLDNHPTVIRDSKSKFKPYKSKFQREQEAQAAVLYSDTGSLASHNSRKSKSSTSTPAQPLTGKIVLAGKLNLPMGFGPATNVKPKVNRHLSAIPENKVNDSEDEDESDEEDGDEEENEGEAESENRNEQEQRPEGWVERDRKGKKKETAEEKKARKQAVKDERKTKRASKKQLKNMFKQEGSSFIRSVGSEQTINHVSVFKYSS